MIVIHERENSPIKRDIVYRDRPNRLQSPIDYVVACALTAIKIKSK